MIPPIAPESSAESSANVSRSHSVSGLSRNGQSRTRHNVKFTVQSPEDFDTPSPHRSSLPELRLPSPVNDISRDSPLPKLPPDYIQRKDAAALNAHDKANRHADKVKRHNTSAPVSRRTSFDQSSTAVASPFISPLTKAVVNHPIKMDDIPLDSLSRQKTRGAFDLPEDDTSEESDDDLQGRRLNRQESHHVSEARNLLNAFTSKNFLGVPTQRPRPGTETPLIDQNSHEYEYVPRPDKYKPSVLSVLLSGGASHSSTQQSQISNEQIDHLRQKLAPYQNPDTDPRQRQADFFTSKSKPSSPYNLSGTQTPLDSSGQLSSGYTTPKYKRPKWYKEQDQAQSTASLGKLLESSFTAAAAPAAPAPAAQHSRRPSLTRNVSSGRLSLFKHPISHIRNMSSSTLAARHQANLEVIADRLECQDYIIEMCRQLMRHGAPTHRLEEFLMMKARRLQIQASFQYMPNCMVISFDDPVTHTTEVKLIKEPTIVDLGKLMDTQEVYKDVMHNRYTLQNAMDDLANIQQKKKRYNTFTLILMYGLAAVSVGPFAFKARPIDMPLSFVLGCLIGFLQLCLASRSPQFSNIFEVLGTAITSFAARGLGSILTSSGEPIFCFTALASSSIALILPGWIILSASLELQARNIVAGSIRMVYAIIYTLFLGFGILVGTTLMGLVYNNANSDGECRPPPEYWDTSEGGIRLLYAKFIWVLVFTLCLAIISQAKGKQILPMLFISFAGYQINYWSSLHLPNPQVANSLGAFVIGVLANVYSRFWHGAAAAAMLPAIFVMVPSGLAASGSLTAGLTDANQITGNATTTNVTSSLGIQNGSASGIQGGNGDIFTVAYQMIQIAIGISFGLFLSSFVVYPAGKKRSGIFSF